MLCNEKERSVVVLLCTLLALRVVHCGEEMRFPSFTPFIVPRLRLDHCSIASHKAMAPPAQDLYS